MVRPPPPLTHNDANSAVAFVEGTSYDTARGVIKNTHDLNLNVLEEGFGEFNANWMVASRRRF